MVSSSNFLIIFLLLIAKQNWADDIPIWGFIGEKEVQRRNGEERSNYYLFTHYIFSVTHNGKKVGVSCILRNLNSHCMDDMMLCFVQILQATWEHDPDSRLDITDATTDTPVQVS